MTSAPRVSDHALVRFLHRAGGLDVEGVRRHLAASLARALTAADRIGAKDVKVVADGMVYVIDDGVVVTCYPPGPPESGK